MRQGHHPSCVFVRPSICSSVCPRACVCVCVLHITQRIHCSCEPASQPVSGPTSKRFDYFTYFEPNPKALNRTHRFVVVRRAVLSVSEKGSTNEKLSPQKSMRQTFENEPHSLTTAYNNSCPNSKTFVWITFISLTARTVPPFREFFDISLRIPTL